MQAWKAVYRKRMMALRQYVPLLPSRYRVGLTDVVQTGPGTPRSSTGKQPQTPVATTASTTSNELLNNFVSTTAYISGIAKLIICCHLVSRAYRWKEDSRKHACENTRGIWRCLETNDCCKHSMPGATSANVEIRTVHSYIA